MHEEIAKPAPRDDNSLLRLSPGVTQINHLTQFKQSSGTAVPPASPAAGDAGRGGRAEASGAAGEKIPDF